MPKKNLNIDPKLQAWIDARKAYRLSHAQVQMARELGLNPKKLGKIDNHAQEPWKLPLGEYIEELYFKHFKRAAPESVQSIEDRVRWKAKQKADKRKARLDRQQTDVETPLQPEI